MNHICHFFKIYWNYNKKGPNPKRALLVFVASVLLSVLSSFRSQAYVLTNYPVNNPSDVKVKIGSTVSNFYNTISTYTQVWENYCAEIGVSIVSSGEDSYFFGDFSIYNDTYAITNHTTKNVTLYGLFASSNTTNLERYEVIAHEMGHVLGLSHCQAAYNSISVMRATGFNGYPRPLADDIAGISALY